MTRVESQLHREKKIFAQLCLSKMLELEMFWFLLFVR